LLFTSTLLFPDLYTSTFVLPSPPFATSVTCFTHGQWLSVLRLQKHNPECRNGSILWLLWCDKNGVLHSNSFSSMV
jgi:hypothetical protein